MMLRFALMMFLIACCVSGVVSVRLTATTTLPLKYKLLIFALLTVVFMAPPLLRCTASGFIGLFCTLLTYALYFLFVCLFLFFCLMFARDAIWIILRLCHFNIPPFMDSSAVLKANLGLLIVVFLLSSYALFEGIRVPAVKTITLTSPKIKAPFAMVVLPDIHLHRTLSRAKIKGIVDQTNSLHPDVVLIPGDLLDDHSPLLQPYLPLFQGFQSTYGTFATYGNHEFYQHINSADYDTAHITLLSNQALPLRPDILLVGVPDIQGYSFHQPPTFLPDFFPQDSYSILMAHAPKMFDFSDNKADLQVSGHTHGGQIFPFHFLSMLSERYLAGLYTEANRSLYVSRGAGQWGPQMRLFAPAEITLIRLLPQP